ncbi:unnamed protein product [Ectocarpus sp. 12 AP-2014]
MNKNKTKTRIGLHARTTAVWTTMTDGGRKRTKQASNRRERFAPNTCRGYSIQNPPPFFFFALKFHDMHGDKKKWGIDPRSNRPFPPRGPRRPASKKTTPNTEAGHA